MAGAVIGLLILYNRQLKGMPGIGNLVIGLLAGCSLLTGGVAAGGLQFSVLAQLWPLVALLALFVTAREVLKTVEDSRGDRAAAKQTLATRWGSQKTLWIFAGLTLQLLFITIYVYWTTGRSMLYLGAMAVGIIGPLCYSFIYLRQNAAPARVAHCLALLKGSYFVGILALLFLVN
ncbi:MAG: UbiA family prenyltransferase [Caldilineaceae bacterium]